MKTLKKVQIVILVIGLLVLGTSLTFAQHKYSTQDGITPPSSSITHPPVIYSHPKGINEVNIGDTPPPYLTAGKDAKICKSGSFTLSGVNTTKEIAMWETSGDGHFKGVYDLDAVYYPGKYDKAKGAVTLTLFIVNADAKTKYKYADSMVLTFGDCVIDNKDSGY